MNSKIPVVFVTSVFGEVHNGPALYANYLWQIFRDEPQINFHLVAPKIDSPHEQLHESGGLGSSRELYKLLQNKAIEVADKIGSSSQATIVHGNNAHGMADFQNYTGPLMVQINDYDAARAFSQSLSNLKHQGLRRLLSLCWRHRMERAVVQKSDLVICNSQFVFNEVAKRYGVKEDNLRVVHKTIDVERFKNATYPPASENKEPNIFFLGSNWIGKGLDVALRALAALPKHLGKVKLTVAGKAPSGSQKIFKLVEQLKLTNQVEFLGNVDRSELPQLLKSMDLLVFPSRNEALGVAVLEALACGLPVVASDVGGIPEILGGTKYSHLVPHNQPDAFAKAITSVLKNNSADQARLEGEKIVESFSVSKMTQAIKSIYLKLAEEQNLGFEINGKEETQNG